MTHQERLNTIKTILPLIYLPLYEEYVYGKQMNEEDASKLVLEGYQDFITEKKEKANA